MKYGCGGILKKIIIDRRSDCVREKKALRESYKVQFVVRHVSASVLKIFTEEKKEKKNIYLKYEAQIFFVYSHIQSEREYSYTFH